MSEAEEVQETEEPLPKPQSIYEVFETDEGLEASGVWFDYAFGRFKLSYVGGANQDFQREYAERMKPYAEAEARGMMDDKVRRQIQIDCYVDYVLKDWTDVIDRNSEDLPYSKEAAKQLFLDLPHLFNMIRTAATNFANYRRIYVDEAVGN